MKQFRFIILLIATSVLLCACPDKEGGHRDIAFVNNSEKGIVCQEFWSGSITNADTLIECRTGASGISPNSLHNFNSLNNSGWETDFKVIPYIQYLIMDAETYDKYIGEPCDTIRKYVPILHRYQLTLADLQQMNWTVVYPPEE
jgi:hypothetical protein